MLNDRAVNDPNRLMQECFKSWVSNNRSMYEGGGVVPHNLFESSREIKEVLVFMADFILSEYDGEISKTLSAIQS